MKRWQLLTTATYVKTRQILASPTFKTLTVGLFALALMSGVNAQSSDLPQAFENVQSAVCSIAGFLQGPIGIGIVLLMVVVGGIMVAVGSRGGTGLLITAGIGAAVLAGARSLVGMVIDTGDGCSDGQIDDIAPENSSGLF